MSPSEVRTLEGTLVYHDGLRQWFELKLDHAQCEQTSLQLIRLEDNWTEIETLRGCRVRSKGPINYSPTGYYSLDMFQEIDEIEPVGDCVRQAPFPRGANPAPDKSIQKYQVEMKVDYRPGDHPVIFRITSEGKLLEPWQAYASYSLTGGFILYGHCAEGFVVDSVFGTQEANPSHFTEAGSEDDMAAFNPEEAASQGEWDMVLGYTCVRVSGSQR